MMDEQLKRINANFKAMKGFIIYALFLSFLSITIKLFLYRNFYIILFINEIFFCLVSASLLILLLLRQKRNSAVRNNYLLLKNSIKGTILIAVFVYALSAFLILKYGPAQLVIDPLLYTNVFIILLIGGAIFFIQSNQTSFHNPQLLLNKKDYVKNVLEESVYLILLFVVALIFTQLLNFGFNHLGNISTLNISLIIIVVNILSHFIFYSVYEWRLAREKESITNKTNGIVSKTLIVFVALYAAFALIKDINHIIFTLRTPNVPLFVTIIHKLDLLIFFYTTMLMILVIFSLRKSLNKTYSHTKNLVNGAVTIWLIKLVNNGLVRINHELLNLLTNYQTTHAIINQILSSLTLVFNLALLIFGLLIISKNTFPNLKLWLILAIVQVINFVFNFSLPLWGDINPGIKLYVNLALTILKLLFVGLIINRYQKRSLIKSY